MIAAPAKPQAGGSYKWWIVGMLWWICFFNYADRVAVASVLPLLQSEFGFSKTDQALISSAFTWVYALTAPFAGQVADRHARKLVIIAGLYIWSAITGFTALCSKLWHFVLVRGAEGLGETFYFPASMSLVSDYHDPSTRSRAMSLHQTSVYAGTIGGGALAGWMGQHYGWQSPFVFLGAAGILLGLVLARFIREPVRNAAELATAAQDDLASRPVPGDPAVHPPTQAAPIPLRQFLAEMRRTPTALILAGAFFGANLVALIFLTWMPSFLKEKFGLTLAVAGLSATVFIQLASMAGAAGGGFLADRARRTRPGGRIGVQALGLILGAPFIFLCGWTREMAVLMLAMTLFGLGKGIYDSNIWASLYDVVPPSRRATAVGMMNLIGWVGGAIGPILVGMAVDRGTTMGAAISSTALIYVLVALLMLWAAGVTAPRDAARLRPVPAQEP